MTMDMFNLRAHIGDDPRLYPRGETQGYARVGVPEVWVFAAPDALSARQTQYTFGEPLRLLTRKDDWWLAQSLRDGYSGWLRGEALRVCTAKPAIDSHSTRFAAPITAQAHFKSAPVAMLPPDSVFTPDDAQAEYVHIADLGWIHQAHVLPTDVRIAARESARECLGKSYVWGGRSVAGLDCSALAQLCYRRVGRALPRDADLQARYLERQHQSVTLDALQADDLIFLPGHVMLAIDSERVIHASGWHMLVVEERLSEVLPRYQNSLKEDYCLHIYRWAIQDSND